MRQELHDTVEQFEKSGEPRKIQKNYLKTNKILNVLYLLILGRIQIFRYRYIVPRNLGC